MVEWDQLTKSEQQRWIEFLKYMNSEAFWWDMLEDCPDCVNDDLRGAGYDPDHMSEVSKIEALKKVWDNAR